MQFLNSNTITQMRLSRHNSSEKLFKRSLISEDQLLQVKQAFIKQTQDLNIESLRTDSVQAQLQQIKHEQKPIGNCLMKRSKEKN